MFGILMIVACAVFYYRVAEIENRSGILWASLSIALSLAAGMVLGLGGGGMLLIQLVPFLLMLGLNMMSDRT